MLCRASDKLLGADRLRLDVQIPSAGKHPLGVSATASPHTTKPPAQAPCPILRGGRAALGRPLERPQLAEGHSLPLHQRAAAFTGAFGVWRNVGTIRVIRLGLDICWGRKAQPPRPGILGLFVRGPRCFASMSFLGCACLCSGLRICRR